MGANTVPVAFGSIGIPIVMLGNDLRIRRFTPQAEKILNLRNNDIGRPIGDFKPKINVPDLELLFLNVIDNLTIQEREVQDRAGRFYSMSVRPYRTLDRAVPQELLDSARDQLWMFNQCAALIAPFDQELQSIADEIAQHGLERCPGGDERLGIDVHQAAETGWQRLNLQHFLDQGARIDRRYIG